MLKKLMTPGQSIVEITPVRAAAWYCGMYWSLVLQPALQGLGCLFEAQAGPCSYCWGALQQWDIARTQRE